MNRRSTSAALLLLGTSLLAPRAHARSLEDPAARAAFGDPAAWAALAFGAVGVTTYVVGGTVTFAILDAKQLAKGEPFSPVLSWMQAGFGSSLVAVGALGLAANASPEISWSVLATGSAFVATPLAEWAFRGRSDAPQAAFSLTPSGVSVRGQF